MTISANAGQGQSSAPLSFPLTSLKTTQVYPLAGSTGRGGAPVDVDRLFSLFPAFATCGGIWALDEEHRETTEMIGGYLGSRDGLEGFSGTATYKDSAGIEVTACIGDFSSREELFDGVIEWHLRRNHALKFNPDYLPA